MRRPEATTRRSFLRQLGVMGTLALCGQRASASNPLPAGAARLVDQFVLEALPEGGVDKTRSLWQKPGRGSAAGGKAFPGG